MTFVSSTDHLTTRTTCPYCGVGCGVVVRGGQELAGDPEHPSNFGRLCSKGSALLETISLEDRLLHPMMRRAGGSYERVSWESALDRLAEGWAHVMRDHGPDATAFYLSGQLLTEDYYAANKLMKGFVGTANVDTNSRLCMSSSVAGHKRAFGADTVPGTYTDLDTADLLVLVGSNAAWCHPILWQRMQANRDKRGGKIVLIDPRRSASAAEADQVLQLRPGTDAVLFSGLLVHLAENGGFDDIYIESHTEGLPVALQKARALAPDIATTAAACGLEAEEVARFFALFASTPRAVTLYSQGVNQSAQGTDKVNAILNVHLATGRIGREGQGPFSLTGQPNAMGGREVGGLANMLAAHMGFSPEEVARVGRFWLAPRMATREGLKAVGLFDAVERGAVKALWVMATNPAVSLPQADRVRAAFAQLDLFAVSDVVLSNDTIAGGPHLLLPALGWGEKDGTVTNSERRISRQRPFLPAPGEAKPDWWIVAELAKRLGFGAAFDWAGPAAIFREHAALSAFENGGTRDFDIGGLKDISDAAYEALAPVQWPLRTGEASGETRFFAQGGFFTPSGKGRFVAPESPALASAPDDAFPFLLNTGRVRDHWHTMTRTGRSPRLSRHIPVPFVAVNPQDAAALGVGEGDFLALTSRYGRATLEVRLDEGQRLGEVFAPIHWSDATSALARVGALIKGVTDPVSGQPELKATPVHLARVDFAVRGVILAQTMPDLPADSFFARAAVPGGVAVRFAADRLPEAIRPAAGEDSARFSDAALGLHRAAVFSEGRLVLAAFAGPAVLREDQRAAFLIPRFGQDCPDRLALLAGAEGEGGGDGALVCACFAVGEGAVRAAIAAGAATVEALGERLRCGTNCGSCKAELRAILAQN